MLMYILMFLSGWRLRQTEPDVKRSFRVPAMALFATLGTLSAIGAILIGFFPPSQLSTSVSPLAYGDILLVGIIILAVPPQIIYHFRSPDWVPAQEEVVGSQ